MGQSEPKKMRSLLYTIRMCTALRVAVARPSLPVVGGSERHSGGPKTVDKARMREKLELTQLPIEALEAIDKLVEKLGPMGFLDPPKHIWVRLVDEDHDQPE